MDYKFIAQLKYCVLFTHLHESDFPKDVTNKLLDEVMDHIKEEENYILVFKNDKVKAEINGIKAANAVLEAKLINRALGDAFLKASNDIINIKID